MKEFAEGMIAATSDVSKKHVQLNNPTIQFLPPLLQQIPHITQPIEGYFEDGRSVSIAQRMVKDGQMYHSLSYRRKRNSASYLIKYLSDGKTKFGEVQYFLRVRVR